MISKIKQNLTELFLPCDANRGRARFFSGNHLWILLLFLIVLKVFFVAFLNYFPSNSFFADITKSAIVELTNKERLNNDLPPLEQNSVLDRAAYLKAQDMLENGYFQHTSPAGVDPWEWFKAAGYMYRYAGENLAIGFIDSGEVNNAWLASPSHRANIMNDKYRDIGIAVVNGNFQGNPATLVVQLFGKRQGVASKASAARAADGKAKTAAAANAPRAADGSDKQVMGASDNAQGGAMADMLAFFAQRYFTLIQWLTYISLLLVVILLVLNFSLRPDFEHADLLAKAVGFLAVASVFALLDQNLTIALIPHELEIF